MQAACHLNIHESCVSCKLRVNRSFCNLPRTALQEFEAIKGAMAYPDHAVLFLEGQTSRGVFILCQGQVKLSMSSRNGKTLILRIAEAGQALGLSATIAGNPFEQTAETIGPCEVGFVRRDDFLRFVRQHNDACFRVAEQLSGNYNSACREIRSLGLSHSAAEKLARLLLEFSVKDGHAQRLVPGLLSGRPRGNGPDDWRLARDRDALVHRAESSAHRTGNRFEPGDQQQISAAKNRENG